MGFDAILRGAIGTLDTVTKSLQATVTIYPYLGQDGYGKPTLSMTGTEYRAVVDYDPQPSRGSTALTLAIKAQVLILQPLAAVAPNAGQTRTQPIDHRDKVVLPDGTTGPIIGTPGIVDPTTERPYFAEILIGKV